MLRGPILLKNSVLLYAIISILDMLLYNIMDNVIVITSMGNMQRNLVLNVILNVQQIKLKHVEEDIEIPYSICSLELHLIFLHNILDA